MKGGLIENMTGKMKSLLGILGVVGAVAMPAAADNTNAVIDSLTSNTNINWGWDIESYQQVDAAANGSVTGTGSGWYRVGSVVSNNAVADEHYEFSGWSGSGVEPGQENANPLVRTSTRDPKTATANFDKKKYDVFVTSEVDGLTDVGSPTGEGSYDAFTSVTSSVPLFVVNPTNALIRYRNKGATKH